MILRSNARMWKKEPYRLWQKLLIKRLKPSVPLRYQLRWLITNRISPNRCLALKASKKYSRVQKYKPADGKETITAKEHRVRIKWHQSCWDVPSLWSRFPWRKLNNHTHSMLYMRSCIRKFCTGLSKRTSRRKESKLFLLSLNCVNRTFCS